MKFYQKKEMYVLMLGGGGGGVGGGNKIQASFKGDKHNFLYKKGWEGRGGVHILT
jgi:hypothetical protein